MREIHYLTIIILLLITMAIMTFPYYNTEEGINTELANYLQEQQAIINKHYKYLSTPDNMVLSDEELFVRGGDCLSWVTYWNHQFDKKNYSYNNVIVSFNGSTNHIISVVSSVDSYCVVDLNNFYCKKVR